MNWDWEKLQKQRQGNPGGSGPPNFDDFTEKFDRFKQLKFPGWKIGILVALVLWLLSGIYIVKPAELGVVKRFGAYNRTTESGPHYRLPFPFEESITPNVTEIQRLEFGFRSAGQPQFFKTQAVPGQEIPEEALMLTGDENIVSIQFTVLYKIKNAENYLFNVDNPEGSIRHAAEAAMREIMGKGRIDEALTTGKERMQDDTYVLVQDILDQYKTGIEITAVQMQNVHPPEQVVEAFKDVASAREDKSRYINEAEAYQRDILPKARGEAARIVNAAQAYQEAKVRKSQGDAARFLSVLAEYNKAKQITEKRLFLETMERILSRPEVEKLILTDDALKKSVPYLPLDKLPAQKPQEAEKQ